LNNYLKRLREAKGYTQGKLADSIRCSRALICRLETERDFPPSEETASDLVKVLGGDPSVLMLAGGKVSQRLRDILQKHPEAFAQLIQQLEDQPEHAILKISRVVKDGKW